MACGVPHGSLDGPLRGEVNKGTQDDKMSEDHSGGRLLSDG